MKIPVSLIKLLSGLYLASLLFGLAAWVMLPFLLIEVYSTRTNGQAVSAEVVGSYVYQQGKTCSLRLTIKPSKGEEVTIGDALPGDIATCGAKKEIAGRYLRGKVYEFLLVGDRYYIGHGQYWWALIIALVGLIPYCYLMRSILVNKNSEAIG